MPSISATSQIIPYSCGLEDILTTEELCKRPARIPDYKAESYALTELAEAMTESPEKIFQKLTDVAMKLCDAGSAGISVSERCDGEDIFRWRATSGEYKQYLGGTMPRNFSPCGVVVDRNAPQLMTDMVKYYEYVSKLEAPPVEVLLVPFNLNDIPIGTVWVVAHTDKRKFDAEDLRIVQSITRFASIAVQNLAKESRLQTALQAGRMGTWELDTESQSLTCSATCNSNYGLSADEELSFEKIVTLIHEDDRQEWHSTLSEAIATSKDFEMQYRILWPDDSVHWIYVRGSCTLTVAGKAKILSGVSADITSRVLLEKTAVEAQKSAEAANLAKSEFLANMSHEIRTPMNAVIGLSSILAKSDGLTHRQKECVHTLQVSADSLLVLINDLLDISKIEAGSIELEHIPFNLGQVFSEVTSMMIIRAKEKGLEFKAEGDFNKEYKFVGDPMRLRQIILNLCSNAIKFTDKGGVYISASIEVLTDNNLQTVSISVTDTGIGIPLNKQEVIFQKFTQADSSINRKFGGTGLGLAIARTLTEVMGGTISLDSSMHKGSTFTVKLPLEAGNDDYIEQTNKPKTLKDTKRDETNRKILLVEDYPANVLVASSYLDLFGYNYDVVGNGHLAFEKAMTGDYAAILMDVQMPGMNGFETTRLIRFEEGKKGMLPTPIIGMTAHALVGDMERCLEVGMDDYISKPYNPDELERKLAAYTNVIA